MSSEGNLQTSKEQLEAQKRIKQEEGDNLKIEIQKRDAQYKLEKNEMSQKLQELLMHNEKVKDDCLKKVIVYKDKYVDYKNKVKSANQQINLLTQRVARFEIERGQMPMPAMDDQDDDENEYADEEESNNEWRTVWTK